MFTIIGGDGKEYGPVSSEQIRGWMAAGRANLETHIRREGETEWKRLGDFPEFSSAPPPPITAATPTASAGPVQINAKAYGDDLIARAQKLDVFQVIGDALNLWTSHFWPIVGATLVVYLALIVSNLIPFVGSLVGFLLNSVFLGGLCYYYLGKLRGEPREIGDAFAGFKRNTGQLVLNGIVSSLLTGVLILPVLIPVFIGIGLVAGYPDHLPAPPTLALLIVVGLVCLLPMMYISVCWQYSHALVIDKNIGFWDALMITRRVVTKQWWRVFAIGFIAGIISMLGLIGLIVGVFLTIPIAFCALIITYERLFNPPPRVSADVGLGRIEG